MLELLLTLGLIDDCLIKVQVGGRSDSRAEVGGGQLIQQLLYLALAFSFQYCLATLPVVTIKY